MRKILLLTIFAALLMTACPCWAGIPHLISYQGMLTDELGNPLTDTLDLTFRIYDVAEAGSEKWEETHDDVAVTDGLFNVILGGSTTPIPSSVFADSVCYLAITVEADPELLPRIRLTSLGYAYRAEWADTSDYSFQSQRADTALYAAEAQSAETDNDWTLSGNNVYRLNGYVGIGTAIPAQKLDVADTVQVAGFKMPNGALDGYVLVSDAYGAGSWQPMPDLGSHWTVTDSVLYTNRLWGIARGDAGNAVYGSNANTMVNLGVTCTTGTPGQDYQYSTVGGGHINRAKMNYATVCGGDQNQASGDYTTVAGGFGNTAGGFWSTAGGGERNSAGGMYSTVPGGFRNNAAGVASFAVGGQVAVEPVAQYTFAFGRACTTSTANAVIFHNSIDPIKVGIQTTSPQRALHIKDVLRLDPRTSAPPNPAEGDIYVNSTDHHIYCYLNGVWRQLDPSP